ncbi:MAG: YgjV family protein, partial [Lachnospiraceae bacterium]|nr:YgjV family protein [Lachnospiraceae bacterium]
LHIITGYLSYKEPTDILSIIAPILTGCVYWFFDSLQIYRLNDILTNILWTIYNIKFKAYILALVSIYTIVVSSAALIRNHFKGIK